MMKGTKKMKRLKKILLIFMISIFTFTINVFAETKNEVTLNFKDGTIHDGYVEYSNIAKVQLFKGDILVTNISNNMKIDLNEAEYKFIIEEIEDSSTKLPIKLKINNWYYHMTTIVGETKSTFKLDTSKFNGTLDIEFERKITAVNTKVENVYNDITSTGVIDLSGGKEYVIDFSKTDELTEGLKSFADLDKTLYYQVFNGSLLVTNDESVAVLKIVGNRSENKAVLTAVNVGTKKSEVFKGLHTKYTGSKLNYDDNDDGILLETRTDYYTRCKYEFTFKYVRDEVEEKEYKFIEGANQTIIKSDLKDMVFKIDADHSLFENNGKIYVDNVLVDSKFYISKDGTIITLKKEFIDILSFGKHTIKFVFSDEKEAITNFTIKEQSTDNINVENPNTSDNIIFYLTTFIISFISLIVLSIIGYRKYKQINYI